MKKYYLFLKWFIKNPIRNASIIPSSKHLIRNITEWLDFDKINTVVELWPWIWSFTEEIIKKSRENTLVILIELNVDYCKYLKKKYWNKVNVLNVSATNINNSLKNLWINKVDLIICWLWLVSMPKEVRDSILEQSYNYIKDWAEFRGFTYMPKILKSTFPDYKIKLINHTFKNFPPAFVYSVI